MAHTIIIQSFDEEPEHEITVRADPLGFSFTATVTDEGADLIADMCEDPEWPNVIT